MVTTSALCLPVVALNGPAEALPIAAILRQLQIRRPPPTAVDRAQRGREPTEQQRQGLVARADGVIQAVVAEHPGHHNALVVLGQHPGTGGHPLLDRGHQRSIRGQHDLAVVPQQRGGLQHALHPGTGLAVVQHRRSSVASRGRIPGQHPFEVQLRCGHPRQLQHPLNHQAITGAAVIEDVHQRHTSRLTGVAVIDHHLNPQGPQRHR